MGMVQSLQSLVRPVVVSFLDFIYPPSCLSCQSPHLDGQRHVCPQCWGTIERITQPHPLYLETRSKLIEGGVSDLVSMYVFEKEGTLQQIMHALKYQGYTWLGVELGRRLGKVVLEWDVRVDYVIPVPLHRRKERERGYNQADRIARGLSDVTGFELRNNFLRRKKYTQTQTQLNIEQRQENMDDAFEVDKKGESALHQKSCLLVDDVITTGATITACTNVLMNAGAAHVIAGSAALAK